MNFGLVQGDYQALKRRLALSVGPSALPDITIDPPKGDGDELSFIRLVAWSYVLIYESGKISLNFLRQLPPWNGKEILPYVRSLRTWSSHNLQFDKDHDIQTIRAAVAWFSETCGVGTPQENIHWQKCFAMLCSDVHRILSLAISACDQLDSGEDAEALRNSLQSKLNRTWAAHAFDSYIVRALHTFGMDGFDVVVIRNRYLNQWRKIVEISSADQLEANVISAVESSLLREIGECLPITAAQLGHILGCKTAAEILHAMQTLKSLEPSDRGELSRHLVSLEDGQLEEGISLNS